jgi:hypothetical protein
MRPYAIPTIQNGTVRERFPGHSLEIRRCDFARHAPLASNSPARNHQHLRRDHRDKSAKISVERFLLMPRE